MPVKAVCKLSSTNYGRIFPLTHSAPSGPAHGHYIQRPLFGTLNFSPKIESSLIRLLSLARRRPVGRYGHTLQNSGPVYLYLFGGVAANGQLNDLWQFDQGIGVWLQITPAFQGALWPFPRTFHTCSFMTLYHTSATIAIINN